MKVLAIETSCDETALALVEAEGGFSRPKFKVLKNLIASQVKIHAPFGGVVPNLAKREHLRNLPILLKKLKHKTSNLKPDLIAVTVGPGLEPALWTGINFAKELYRALNPKPHTLYPKLVGANHLEGHLYSFLLPQKTANSKSKFLISKIFPAVALIVSGGHTILLVMKNLKSWEKLGETRDDAAGEAFDKVARLLKLPYPGGPEIQKLALRGNPNAIDFPRPMLNDKSYDFSFSGLKTSVLYYLRDHPLSPKTYSPRLRESEAGHLKPDIAASFQQAAIDVLIKKTMRAAKEFGAKSIMLSGGVASNKLLRKKLEVISHQLSVNFMVSPMKFNTDNAVMIAAAGYFTYLRKKKYKLVAQGNLGI